MLNLFRVVAFFEGLSYILLLFVATPIKYVWHDPKYVKMLGMPHGLLFIGYILLAFVLRKSEDWDSKSFNHIILASIIPFGTFYIERKYLNPSKK